MPPPCLDKHSLWFPWLEKKSCTQSWLFPHIVGKSMNMGSLLQTPYPFCRLYCLSLVVVLLIFRIPELVPAKCPSFGGKSNGLSCRISSRPSHQQSVPSHTPNNKCCPKFSGLWWFSILNISILHFRANPTTVSYARLYISQKSHETSPYLVRKSPLYPMQSPVLHKSTLSDSDIVYNYSVVSLHHTPNICLVDPI